MKERSWSIDALLVWEVNEMMNREEQTKNDVLMLQMSFYYCNISTENLQFFLLHRDAVYINMNEGEVENLPLFNSLTCNYLKNSLKIEKEF